MRLGQIEDDLGAYVEEARDVLGALGVAAHPVQSLGGSAQHAGTPLPFEFESPAGPARTQVSFVPPPCEEFTTYDPFLSATLVSPPGRTKISSPPWST